MGNRIDEIYPAQQYGRRHKHNHVSNAILDGTADVTIDEVLGLVEDDDTNIRNEQGGPWRPYQVEVPSPYDTGGEGSIGAVMNAGERVPTTEFFSLIFGYKYAPIDLSDWGSLGNSSFATQLLYNVKTWNLSATIAGINFSETIPAGTSVSNSGATTRPNDGKRGRYGFTVGVSDGDGSKNVFLNIHVGFEDITKPALFLHQNPVANVFLPDIRVQIIVDEFAVSSEQLNTYFVNADAEGSNYGASILGQDILFLDSEEHGTGSTPWGRSMSMTITPDEFWGTEQWEDVP